jgi:hypothetical protein
VKLLRICENKYMSHIVGIYPILFKILLLVYHLELTIEWSNREVRQTAYWKECICCFCVLEGMHMLLLCMDGLMMRRVCFFIYESHVIYCSYILCLHVNVWGNYHFFLWTTTRLPYTPHQLLFCYQNLHPPVKVIKLDNQPIMCV